MAVPTPAAPRVTGLTPYYRRYELPWSPSEEMERRFRTILRGFIIVFVICAIAIPFLPRHERITNTESLPERVVQLVLEPPPPPPPPPPPKPEKVPVKAPVSVKPQPAAPVDPKVKASKSGLLAQMDDLAALRDVNLDKLKNQQRTTDPGDVSEVQRNLLTSKVTGTSGGISAPTSSGLAAGTTSLNGIRTSQVKDPTLAGNGQPATRSGGTGKASRGADEIALVFTQNKGAIDSMYARALRDNPALQGKVVLELTITPAGDITDVRIVSSDLNNPEFEAKLVARVKLFKFQAKDVGTLKATKPIDFFPAG